jgi:hypothetical protein
MFNQGHAGICQPQYNTQNHQIQVNGRNHQLQGGGTIGSAQTIQKITNTSSIVSIQS